MPFPENPFLVSILLAARNEEANIERCLLSLNSVDYPTENLEICIGDDDSSDKTAQIIQNFIADKPWFRYFRISCSVAGLRGKANVLAQLAQHANGTYLLFCDADIAVPPTWIRAILAQFKEDTGTVLGLTRMKKSHYFADFLSLEWLFILTIVRFASLFKIPMTGLGNNMAVTKRAYQAVGGYEALGFSVIEDYALFMAVTGRGYSFGMAYNPEVLSWSEPVNNLKELRIQRKRWMQGVMHSFWSTRLSTILSGSIAPILLILAFWFPLQSFKMLLSHYLAITLIAFTAIRVLKQNDLLKILPFFWFYMLGNTIFMLINYLAPGKMTWKGRTYQS